MRSFGTINALFTICTFLGAGSAWPTYASDPVPLSAAAIRANRPSIAASSALAQSSPCALVGSEGIFLDDLVAAFTNVTVPHLRVGEAPLFGQSFVYPPAKILAAWNEIDPKTSPIATNLIPDVRVARKARILDESEIRDMLIACLQKTIHPTQGDLIIRLARPWTPVKVPDEAIEFRALDMPAANLRSSFVVRFELKTGRETIGSWQMPVQAQLFRQVWIARVPIKRGQAITESDFVLEQRDILGLREPLAQWNPAESDFECSDYVPAGYPLLARSLKPRAVIHRGDLVEALLQDGLMSILVKVEALEEGSPGQVVRVRNLQTKRELRGKVQNEQTILINL